MKNIVTPPDSKKVVSFLKENGYILLDRFVNQSTLERLTEDFDRVFNSIPDRAQTKMDYPSRLEQAGTYSPGKHCCIQRPAYVNFPSLLDIFNKPFFRDVVTGYCGPSADFMLQTFMSHDYLRCESQEEISRSNWLHWDPYPSLKFFVYLTDVVPGAAATHFIPGSRSYGRKYRMKTSLTDHSGWQGGCRHRLEDWQGIPEYTNRDAKPVHVKAGTLLIFDTDSLHF